MGHGMRVLKDGDIWVLCGCLIFCGVAIEEMDMLVIGLFSPYLEGGGRGGSDAVRGIVTRMDGV